MQELLWFGLLKLDKYHSNLNLKYIINFNYEIMGFWEGTYQTQI